MLFCKNLYIFCILNWIMVIKGRVNFVFFISVFLVFIIFLDYSGFLLSVLE